MMCQSNFFMFRVEQGKSRRYDWISLLSRALSHWFYLTFCPVDNGFIKLEVGEITDSKFPYFSVCVVVRAYPSISSFYLKHKKSSGLTYTLITTRLKVVFCSLAKENVQQPTQPNSTSLVEWICIYL